MCVVDFFLSRFWTSFFDGQQKMGEQLEQKPWAHGAVPRADGKNVNKFFRITLHTLWIEAKCAWAYTRVHPLSSLFASHLFEVCIVRFAKIHAYEISINGFYVCLRSNCAEIYSAVGARPNAYRNDILPNWRHSDECVSTKNAFNQLVDSRTREQSEKWIRIGKSNPIRCRRCCCWCWCCGRQTKTTANE